MIATGGQIRAARALLGWSREDLAERAGVHPQTISYWELRAPPKPRQGVTAPERMLAALRSAGVEIASEPRPGVFLAGNG